MTGGSPCESNELSSSPERTLETLLNWERAGGGGVGCERMTTSDSSSVSSRVQQHTPIKQQQATSARIMARTKIHHQSPVRRANSEVDNCDSTSSSTMVTSTDEGDPRPALVRALGSIETTKVSSFSMLASGATNTWTTLWVSPGLRTMVPRVEMGGTGVNP